MPLNSHSSYIDGTAICSPESLVYATIEAILTFLYFFNYKNNVLMYTRGKNIFTNECYHKDESFIYIYYPFIVHFLIGLDFLFITFTFLLHLLISRTSLPSQSTTSNESCDRLNSNQPSILHLSFCLSMR